MVVEVFSIKLSLVPLDTENGAHHLLLTSSPNCKTIRPLEHFTYQQPFQTFEKSLQKLPLSLYLADPLGNARLEAIEPPAPIFQ